MTARVTPRVTITERLGLEVGDLHLLAKLAVWHEPGRTRQTEEWLLGPQYARLRKAGLIDTPMTYTESGEPAGRPVVLTELAIGILDELGCRPDYLRPDGAS